ncbi:hypothetical protein T07_6663 [Trichinella nelsoni]|uniref:Uncharacterized protein n=1 Tax=Trichinella nelsoni TaxID=6336 RepID=A0A0V0RS92_9BILA|nr:hypothetical protein T07_6663 [Trichinella nelsoni]
MGSDNCSECFGDSLQAANLNSRILCVLIRIGTLFYKTSKAISLAISCVSKQIEKNDKKQLSLKFYPYENLLFLVEGMNLSVCHYNEWITLHNLSNSYYFREVNDECGLLFNL